MLHTDAAIKLQIMLQAGSNLIEENAALASKYTTVSYIAAALCVISLAITLFLFFKYNVIGIIGDLSGSNARKGIENIRNQNRASGNKAHKPSHVNLERGRLTDKITPSGAVISAGESVGVSVGTEKFNTGKLTTDETTVLGMYNTGELPDSAVHSDETTILGASNSAETTVLSAGANETTVLSVGYDETTVLSSGIDETTVLGMNYAEGSGSEIIIEEEIIFVHSNEQIN